MNADNHSAYLDTTSTYTYDPRDRIATVVKTGAGAGTERYLHDPNNNVISATFNGIPTAYNYDRDRLLTAVVGSLTASYNYDPFGRLDTVTLNGQVLARKVYDGFDRVIEDRSTAGGTTRYSYDPLDRTATRTTGAGTAGEKTTTFNYLGLTSEVLDEEVAGKVARSYQYSPWGERLSQTTATGTGAGEPAYYGYNAHADVETLTDASGDTKATYGYTAYGRNDDGQFTGIDKPDAADPAKEPYNPYRFNAKRWDQGTGEYDMGFRDYSPALNRFLTRDMYNGALADLNLTTNPFTGNRYAFGGGNPITNIELDGHIPDDCARDIRCTTDAEGHWIVEERTSAPEDQQPSNLEVRIDGEVVDDESDVERLVNEFGDNADRADSVIQLCAKHSATCARIDGLKIVSRAGAAADVVQFVLACPLDATEQSCGSALTEIGIDLVGTYLTGGWWVPIKEIGIPILAHIWNGLMEQTPDGTWNFNYDRISDPEVNEGRPTYSSSGSEAAPYLQACTGSLMGPTGPVPPAPVDWPRGVEPQEVPGC
jgi:RHS repeat-associated protein